MTNISIAIFPIGSEPGCSIFEIAAVKFDPNTGLGDEFYCEINRKSCMDAGLFEDKYAWNWIVNDHKGSELDDKRAMDIGDALSGLANFVDIKGKRRFWSLNMILDNTILERAYTATGQQIPWHRWMWMDLRTADQLLSEKLHSMTINKDILGDLKSCTEMLLKLVNRKVVNIGP